MQNLQSRYLLFFLLLWLHQAAQGQFPLTPVTNNPTPDTVYHPFYNGRQLIIIERERAWQQQVDYMEMTKPRALSYSHLIPRPGPDTYLFRNRSGEVVLAFNTDLALPQWSGHLRKDFGFTTQIRRLLQPYYKIYTVLPATASRPENPDTLHKAAGLIDSLGNWVLPIQYEHIQTAGRLFLVKQKGHFGLLDPQASVVLPLQYKGVYEIGKEELIFYEDKMDMVRYPFAAGKPEPLKGYDWIDAERLEDRPYKEDLFALIRIRKDGKTGFIDAQYKIRTPPVYDYADIAFRDGRVRVNRKGKWGYVDTTGKEVIPCMYDDVTVFYEGRASVLKNGDWFCITVDGDETPGCDAQQRKWSARRNGAFGTFKGVRNRWITGRVGLYGLTDDHEKVIVPLIYNDIDFVDLSDPVARYSSDYFTVKAESKWGVINRDGKLVIPMELDEVYPFNAGMGYAILRKDSLFGLVDREFNWVLPCIYQGLNYVGYRGKIIFMRNNKWGWMHPDQTVIVPPRYDHIGWVYDGVMQVQNNNKYGIVDTLGRELIPCIYDQLGTKFSNGRIVAGIKEKYGLIDSNGAVLIPLVYDDLQPFDKDIAGARKGKYFGFVNLKGEPLSAFEYDHINNAWQADGTINVRKKNKVGLADSNGREVVPCIYDDYSGYRGEKGHYFKKDGVWMYVKLQ